MILFDGDITYKCVKRPQKNQSVQSFNPSRDIPLALFQVA